MDSEKHSLAAVLFHVRASPPVSCASPPPTGRRNQIERAAERRSCVTSAAAQESARCRVERHAVLERNAGDGGNPSRPAQTLPAIHGWPMVLSCEHVLSPSMKSRY